jgi:hypothetical protein
LFFNWPFIVNLYIMVRTLYFFAALATASVAYAQASCGLNNKCPSDTPCCSRE